MEMYEGDFLRSKFKTLEAQMDRMDRLNEFLLRKIREKSDSLVEFLERLDRKIDISLKGIETDFRIINEKINCTKISPNEKRKWYKLFK